MELIYGQKPAYHEPKKVVELIAHTITLRFVRHFGGACHQSKGVHIFRYRTTFAKEELRIIFRPQELAMIVLTSAFGKLRWVILTAEETFKKDSQNYFMIWSGKISFLSGYF
jgi:hypothetical protein